MNRKLLCFLLVLVLVPLAATALAEEKKLTVLFTSDIHSYFITSTSEIDGTIREHGGAGRLMTLLNENRNDHTILVDAGDFAMGTLLQAGYNTDAYELRLMGRLGFDATTFGNHEFDLTCQGAAEMLNAAVDSGEPLPVLLIPANLDLSGTLNENQQNLKDALARAGSVTWILKDVGGVKVAVFGLMGTNAITCAPTSGVVWGDPVTAAQRVVKEIGDQADVIICVSHSGTKGDGKTGEDIDLLKKVDGIDVVISGHTHTTYPDAVVVKDGTVLGSCGCFLSYLGRMDLTVKDDSSVTVDSYHLIPVDENVTADEETEAVTAGYLQEINAGYMAGTGYTSRQLIAHSDFTLSNTPVLEEMPLGDLIADSYLTVCRNNGVEAEVAVVACGTIRTSLLTGDITVADAFEVCSLGEGSDGSVGHPVVAVYAKGSELKLLAEMDALIGPFFHSVILNYGGLAVEQDANRIPFDRVTSVSILREDGTKEPVENDRLYLVVGNMYAINMLSSIKSMTYGLIDLPMYDKNGVQISADDLYNYAVTNASGKEIKEWVAFCDQLSSFDATDGIAQIPERYASAQGRKIVRHGNLIDVLKDPGIPTLVVELLALLIIALIIFLIATRKKRKARRDAKKAARREKRGQS